MTESSNEQSDVPAVPGTGEVRPYDGPPLVYGLTNFEDNLVVVAREWAERRVDELARWMAATTWREALAVADSMTALKPPLFCPEEIREELGEDRLDDPFDANEDVEYWDESHDDPLFPCEFSLATVPDDWAVGEVGGYAWTGLYIDPADEPRLLAFARAAGAVLGRDDDLVNHLMWPGGPMPSSG